MRGLLPKVRVIGTGGTIAGLGRDRLDLVAYTETERQRGVAEMVARLPEASSIARVETEQVFELPSPAIGPKEWAHLAGRIDRLFRDDSDLAGVVVTHGTATMEETAYFLHLTVRSDRPVVLTGAMRPPSGMSSDADINLINAIRVAACPDARGKGVLHVFNEQVHSAREVTKTNTSKVETFKPGDLGFLGYADPDGSVVFYRTPTRRHTTASEFDVSAFQDMPRVDIVSAYSGGDGLLIQALFERGVTAIVVASTGDGSLPPAMYEAAADAVRRGATIVVSSRVGSGRVMQRPKFAKAGFIVADDLLPQKARVLLMLGLSVTRDRAHLQRMFFEY